jgi:hypothetical protein
LNLGRFKPFFPRVIIETLSLAFRAPLRGKYDPRQRTDTALLPMWLC